MTRDTEVANAFQAGAVFALQLTADFASGKLTAERYRDLCGAGLIFTATRYAQRRVAPPAPSPAATPEV